MWAKIFLTMLGVLATGALGTLLLGLKQLLTGH